MIAVYVGRKSMFVERIFGSFHTLISEVPEILQLIRTTSIHFSLIFQSSECLWEIRVDVVYCTYVTRSST
jgi:hypothetical protein